MGLDMYLHSQTYLANYDHFGTDPERETFRKVVSAVGAEDFVTPLSPHVEVAVCVGYWRKQNAIHKWFVDNVQGGKDECQKSYVSREDLTTLFTKCEAVLADQSLAPDTLPTTSGFFFGGTEYDEWYWDGILYTRDLLRRLLDSPLPETTSFYYQASW